MARAHRVGEAAPAMKFFCKTKPNFCQNEAKEEFSRNRMSDAVMEHDPVGYTRIGGWFPITGPMAALTHPTRQRTLQNFLQNEANEEFPC
jgi:hypothetical protein